MEIWFEQVWNQGNEDTIHEMMDEECEIKGLGLSEKGAEAFLGFYRTFQGAFDGIHIDLIDLMEEGENVMGNARFTAVHRQSGKKVDFVFSALGRWRDGKIVEARNVVDFTTMLTQVGALDESVMRTALGG